MEKYQWVSTTQWVVCAGVCITVALCCHCEVRCRNTASCLRRRRWWLRRDRAPRRLRSMRRSQASDEETSRWYDNYVHQRTRHRCVLSACCRPLPCHMTSDSHPLAVTEHFISALEENARDNVSNDEMNTLWILHIDSWWKTYFTERCSFFYETQSSCWLFECLMRRFCSYKHFPIQT